MGTRLGAASILAVSALIAWGTITIPFAARVLQVSILASMAYVAWLAWRGSTVMRRALADARRDASAATAHDPDAPFVTLLLPARNEAPVIRATVRSLRDLRYHGEDGEPAYELLVVDDGSTDETADRVRQEARGAPHITIRRREPGAGPRTKGAVLDFAMPFVRGDVIGVVDADSRVEPAFLERVVRAWRRDPGAAALQVERRTRNVSASWLTRSQAVEELIDLASQCGRWATDGTAELRGNGMFVRREALEAVGGWNTTALTEDLELSTRLSVAGHRITLAPETGVHQEAVETISALWSQRLRWAEGSVRRLLEHGPGLLVGSQPMGRKADFLVFATEFLVPPLFAATLVASLVTIPLPQPADWTVPASLVAGYGLGVFFLAAAGLAARGERGLRLIGRAVGGALFVSHWLLVVPVALARIAFGPERSFVQTPRFSADADR